LLAAGAPRPSEEEREDLPDALQDWLDETVPEPEPGNGQS